MNCKSLVSVAMAVLMSTAAFAQQVFDENVTFEKNVTFNGNLNVSKGLSLLDKNGTLRYSIDLDPTSPSSRPFYLSYNRSNDPFYYSMNMILDTVVAGSRSWKFSSRCNSPAPVTVYAPLVYEASSHNFVGGDLFIGEVENDYYQSNAKISAKGDVGAVSLLLRKESFSTYRNPSMGIQYDAEKSRWEMMVNGSSTSQGTLDAPLYIYAGAGTTIDGGNLVVNGNIQCKDNLKVVEIDTKSLRANDIKVDLNNAADYVFEENYDLKSLNEVEAYVKVNKHLPGVPSAAELKNEGMSVSEMSNLLLEKVEELTLHMIELKKENQALKNEIEALKK